MNSLGIVCSNMSMLLWEIEMFGGLRGEITNLICLNVYIRNNMIEKKRTLRFDFDVLMNK